MEKQENFDYNKDQIGAGENIEKEFAAQSKLKEILGKDTIIETSKEEAGKTEKKSFPEKYTLEDEAVILDILAAEIRKDASDKEKKDDRLNEEALELQERKKRIKGLLEKMQTKVMVGQENSTDEKIEEYKALVTEIEEKLHKILFSGTLTEDDEAHIESARKTAEELEASAKKLREFRFETHLN